MMLDDQKKRPCTRVQGPDVVEEPNGYLGGRQVGECPSSKSGLAVPLAHP